MQHDLRRGGCLAHTAYPGGKKRGKLVEIVRFSIRPQEAVTNLVAHLDDVRGDIKALKIRQCVSRVSEDSIRQTGKIKVTPGGRLLLVRRIRPGIAIVEIE